MRPLCGVSMTLLLLAGAAGAETVRLTATADIWLSDANASERDSSAGKNPRFKLKSIQEMAAIRFDPAPAAGREVLKARLFLHPAGRHMLRHVRVSTVNGDWEEGTARGNYSPGNGATYNHADHASKRPWAWAGSQFCDVVMGSGNTLACWGEIAKGEGGWVSVGVAPALIYALVAGDTDGLCVMDGGTLALSNNFARSRESGRLGPYLQVELGKELKAAPARPAVSAAPAPGAAHLATGAIAVTVRAANDVHCLRLKLNGTPIERWRVPHPKPGHSTKFALDEVPPGRACKLEVVAVAPGGSASEATVVEVTSSAALSQELKLGAFRKPVGGKAPPLRDGKMKVWAYPPLVKLSPQKGTVMFDDMGAGGDYRSANAVWDGEKITLHGCRGEYVAYQLCIERASFKEPLKGVRITPKPLSGAGGAEIALGEIELFRNWCVQNRDKKWQPAYCIPLAPGEALEIPDPKRKLRFQGNQSLYVDVYVPKDAKPGEYAGAVEVQAGGVQAVSLPVKLTVHDFVLPDRLSFWPELNAYNVPGNFHEYYRLAHQHRCIMNCWVIRPQLTGSGAGRKVIWDRYDKAVGPLLDGSAFAGNRRAGAPVECMYLPFEDSWPTPLSKDTYDYQGHWPTRGQDRKHIIDHQMKAPYIGEALSAGYKDAFLAVQRQFIEHFKEKGWNRTEMQCFYGGKNTHRTQYGTNMWWTTDEPYHWEDWLALQFFDRLWCKGRAALKADKARWAARADISRPQWQGRVLDRVVDTVYFGTGAFSSPNMYRRCRLLERDAHLKIMVYGSANRDNASNSQSVVWILNAWANRAHGVLPWQTLARADALDRGDAATSGNALLVPGGRFGRKVVGDMRLKALRTGQQLAEYLAILAKRHALTREQIKAMVHRAVTLRAGVAAGAGADNADALRFGTLKAWQIAELRRNLAELIVRRAK